MKQGDSDGEERLRKGKKIEKLKEIGKKRKKGNIGRRIKKMVDKE